MEAVFLLSTTCNRTLAKNWSWGLYQNCFCNKTWCSHHRMSKPTATKARAFHREATKWRYRKVAHFHGFWDPLASGPGLHTVDLSASAAHTVISRDWRCKRGIKAAHRKDQVAEHTMFMFVKRNTTVLAWFLTLIKQPNRSNWWKRFIWLTIPGHSLSLQRSHRGNNRD